MADSPGRHVISRNRKARHEYEVLETFEAGLVLKGPEVKSVRAGKVGFKDAFARLDNHEVWLHHLHISPYEPATRWNEDPERPAQAPPEACRDPATGRQGRGEGVDPDSSGSLLPPGLCEADAGPARGRKLYDKREKLRRRTQEREAERAMRYQG